MVIRKAESKDVKAMLALWKGLMEVHEQLYGSVYEMQGQAVVTFSKHLSRIIKSTDYGVFVAEEGVELVGYLLVSRQERPPVYKLKLEAKINDIFVREDCRNKGIGTALLNAAKIWAKENKLEYLSLEVDSKNDSALQLYKEFGFEDFHLKMMKKI